jgi:hypothetical protein
VHRRSGAVGGAGGAGCAGGAGGGAGVGAGVGVGVGIFADEQLCRGADMQVLSNLWQPIRLCLDIG